MTDKNYTTLPARPDQKQDVKTMAAQEGISMISLLDKMIALYRFDRDFNADARKRQEAEAVE